MGHAFEEAIIDTLVRFKRMCGYNTLWLLVRITLVSPYKLYWKKN